MLHFSNSLLCIPFCNQKKLYCHLQLFSVASSKDLAEWSIIATENILLFLNMFLPPHPPKKLWWRNTSNGTLFSHKKAFLNLYYSVISTILTSDLPNKAWAQTSSISATVLWLIFKCILQNSISVTSRHQE